MKIEDKNIVQCTLILLEQKDVDENTVSFIKNDL